MHKGFIQLGNLIFIVFVFVMVFLAGYLYFFTDPAKITSNVMAVNLDQRAQIEFIHPLYNYTLKIPYGWKGKYKVTETGDQTNFWFTGVGENYDLLFGVKRQPVGDQPRLVGDNKTLGQKGDFLYVLITPTQDDDRISSVNQEMRREILSIGESFSSVDIKPAEMEISHVLSNLSTTTESLSVSFPAFEVIATKENASTTEYYIWFVRQKFAWKGIRLRDWPVESLPAVVTLDKNNKLISLRLPRSGANLRDDINKIFPKSVRESGVFLSNSAEHQTMLDKLNSRLSDSVVAYFGAEPVLTRAGFIENVSFRDTGLELSVFFAEKVVLSASSTHQVLEVNKNLVNFFVASSAPAVSLPATTLTNKLGKVISSTSPQIMSSSDWPSIFSKTSTSTWKKRPFWLEIQRGEVLKISPL